MLPKLQLISPLLFFSVTSYKLHVLCDVMLVSVFTVILYYRHDILQTEQGDSKPKIAVTKITASACCCSLNLNAKITVNMLAHIVDLRDLFDHLFFF